MLAVIATGLAAADAAEEFTRWPIRTGYQAELLARAQPDEYYYGVGSNANTYVAEGIDLGACFLSNGLPKPKINESYIWGMARAGRKLYIGTVANGNALAAAGYGSLGGMAMPASADFGLVQEFGASYYGQTQGIAAPFGDWRPPRICRYDLDEHTFETLNQTLPPDALAILMQLEGLRAAGAVPPSPRNPRGLVVLAGPRIQADVGGVGFFFFDGTSGDFLGATLRPEFSNIRRMVACNDDLYAAVQNTGPDGFGSVIRIVNTRRSPRFPADIEIVGNLDQGGADIAAHDGRLFVTTWPGYLEGGQLNIQEPLQFIQRAAGLWMSPPVPRTGLTPVHRGAWTKVWHVNLYDPDPLMAATYAGGALASFDGWLYFGTMHGEMTQALPYKMMHNLPESRPPDGAAPGSPAFTDWLANRSPGAVYPRIFRYSSIFRARNFRTLRALLGVPVEAGGEFELLYGYHTVQAWNPTSLAWETRTNVLNQTPLMGPAGLGSESRYVWSMAVFDQRLYVGTLGPLLIAHGTLGEEALYRTALADPTAKRGAALLMLPSSRAGTFLPVSESGLGNPCNYGIRTLVPTDEALYVGTANAYNLMADPDDDLPDGGWELLKLTRRPPPAFDVDGDYLSDPAWLLADGNALALGSDGPSTNTYVGVAFSRPAWADYDGDGCTDPGWFTPFTGRWRARLSTHAGALLDIAVTPGLKAGVIPAPADFDGDGEADLAWCDPVTGAITWQSLADGAKTNSPVASGRVGSVPAVADYDGDGRADFAWYVQASGEWIISPAAGSRRSVRLAAVRGTPVPADFDGDGRADLAVCNAANGSIRVLRYSAGGAPFTTPEAPGRDWLPMCGDYDGDSRADFAWYLPQTFMLRIRFADGSSGEWAVPEVGESDAQPVAVAQSFRAWSERLRR
jgi:hypothetical protein